MTPRKKKFDVKVSITGTAHVSVEAFDEEDAKRALLAGEGVDGVTEWSYDDIISVTEET